MTSSSQLPVGGLNSLSFTPAGGVDDSGFKLFFLCFFAGAAPPVLRRPRFFCFAADAFFSSHCRSKSSLPPTFARYASRIAGAVSLYKDQSIDEQEIDNNQQIAFWLPGPLTLLFISFPFDLIFDFSILSKMSVNMSRMDMHVSSYLFIDDMAQYRLHNVSSHNRSATCLQCRDGLELVWCLLVFIFIVSIFIFVGFNLERLRFLNNGLSRSLFEDLCGIFVLDSIAILTGSFVVGNCCASERMLGN
jgi:hypothetical protein